MVWLTLLDSGVRAAPDLLQPENLQSMGCEGPTAAFLFHSGSRPGNLFHPKESVDITVLVPPAESLVRTAMVDVVEITTRGAEYLERPNEAGTAKLARVSASRVLGQQQYDVESMQSPGLTNLVDLRGLPVPDRYGTYAVRVTLDGAPPVFLCTVARLPKPVGGRELSPVLGPGDYLTGDNPDPELVRLRAQALARMGITVVRVQTRWEEPAPRQYDWRRLDALMSALEEARIKALVTLSGHPEWSMPLGEPTPSAMPGNPDLTCQPAAYDAFARYVYELCARCWRGGQGALWAVELWDKPWDSVVSTGWQSDTPHYVALFRRMVESARRVDPRIRTAGAGSIVNTEARLLTGDEVAAHMEWIDEFTDQFAPPYTCYGPLVARRWNRESLDLEAWVGTTERGLGQVMVQLLACGQRHVSPWPASSAMFGVPGGVMRYQMPAPTVVATAAFNQLVSGLTFQGCLQTTHLPWAFQFGTGPGVLVAVVGRLDPLGSADPRGLPWWQLNLSQGGTLRLENTDGSLELYDIAGNREFEGETEILLKADGLVHYLRSPAGGIRLIEAKLRDARLDGFPPVELVARDFTTPLEGRDPAVRVTVHNLLNRAVSGRLVIHPPEGLELDENERTVKLGEGETRDFEMPLRVNRADPANAYPFRFAFESGAGTSLWQEVLHDLVVRRGRVTVDGHLDEWLRTPGVPLQARPVSAVSGSLSNWPPFVQARHMASNALLAEVKAAWNEKYLFLCAQVNDPTPSAGHVRLATWDEDQYFYGPGDDKDCELLRPHESLVLALPDGLRTRPGVLQSLPGWRAFVDLMSTNEGARTVMESGVGPAYLRGKRRWQEAGLANASHVYKRAPWMDRPYVGDTLQVGFDVMPGWDHHRMVAASNAVPAGFQAEPDTDYEFCVYACRDGMAEVWRSMAPGVPRSHPSPRQPRASVDQGPVKAAQCVIVRDGSLLIYELAIPWSEMPAWRPRPNQRFRCILRVNDDRLPPLTFGAGKSATKSNGLSLHPYYEAKPSCSVDWSLGD